MKRNVSEASSSASERFAHFFKPEVQRAGRDLIKKKSVFLQIGTDTQIDASIRATTPSKVRFQADSIGDESFEVDCSCPSSTRGQLCKHIWAVLELASSEKPDFFESKSTLEKGDLVSARAKPQGAGVKRDASADFKEKQATHRKSVYESQKARAKEFQKKRKDTEQFQSIRASSFSKALPDEIRSALEYFEKNGFPLTIPVDEPTVSNAKRILSRVFHPDKGGTHDEIVELLRHSDALIKYRL